MMKIYSRRKAMASILYDAEIEYLESTGTQYIDTGIFTVYNDGRTYKHIANLYYTVTNERQINGANGSGYFGINKNGKFECAYIEDSGISARDSWHNINFSYYNPTDRSLNIKYKIDNQLKERNATSITLYNYAYAIYIFAIGGRDGAAPLFFCKERIKSYQIYIDEVLVRDLIPVRVGNIGYMYDKVSGKLFGNAGTGNFILGPDK